MHDQIEQPYLVNPEITDPTGMIVFDKEGGIDSDDRRFYYTIRTCQINRAKLNQRRKELLGDLRRDLKAEFFKYTDINDQRIAVRAILDKFRTDSEDINKEFLAFRRYVLTHWIKEEILAIINWQLHFAIDYAFPFK